MLKILKQTVLICLWPIVVWSQISEVNPPDYIKTITFKSRNSDQGELPIIRLGETFYLEFDVLKNNEPDFYYTIEHYNYDWTKSNLVKAEYLRGFDNFRLVDYVNSFNTYEIYSHYRLTVPNQQTRALLVSGNYLLSIFDEYGDLMFTRKFMIVEDLAGVGVSIKRYRDVTQIDEKQSVDISISPLNLNFNNPLETVKVLIIQNNNLNTALYNIKPQYVLGNELIYRYNTETGFWGGNEYLFFENRDVRAANIGVQFIDLLDIYHGYLFTNVVRKDLPYTYNPDINGRFVVTVIDREDPSVEADYVNIHFSLNHPELTDGSNIYVYGNYNNFATDESNVMYFNSKKQVYEAVIKLKQGFYNYKYVVVDANGNLNEGAISGNFWQTENNYKVLVYYRDLGARYDRLIGFGEGTSVNITN
jgi:hypothetical protein